MKSNPIKKIILSNFLILLFGAIVYAQETNPAEEETIKVETVLLNVPVMVGDRQGRYLAGLKQENFYIVENGIKRPVDFFADDSAPLNVAILVDTSGSTSFILGQIKRAASDFISVLRPEDKAMIVGFDTGTTIWSEFTSDQKQLEKAVYKMFAGGGSVMFDTMYLIMKKHFAPLRGRKAIIVLTDGMVSGRGVSEEILFKALAESDIMVYPLLFDLPNLNKLKNNSVQKFAYNRMNRFAEISGGKTFNARETDFKTAFQNIAEELKKQYVVGFYPANEKIDKTFKVGLHLDKLPNPANVVLRTKKVIRFKKQTK